MRVITIVLELEDEKFDAMEKVLVNDGYKNYKENWSDDEWTKLVIETYRDTEPYLDCHDGNLEAAYKDMKYDF